MVLNRRGPESSSGIEKGGTIHDQAFYVLLYEQPALTHDRVAKRSFSTKKILHIATDELKRSCAVLLGRAQSFQRSMDDLLGTKLLYKREAFAFFRYW
jgi:hypothetical protein